MSKKTIDGENCTFDKGRVVKTWYTGDGECNDYSKEYECGGVYNNNYMDMLGFKDHDCFWQCNNCKYKMNGSKEA